MQKTIWTIGHSTHSIEEFVALLLHYNIEQVADVRKLPGSNKFPQFNSDTLAKSLADHHIGYAYFKLLGGLRPANKDSKNTAWVNKSFRNYADYMETSSFKEGVAQLEAYAEQRPTAIMCAEVLWWRCHRSMIADYLKAKGWTVIHILSLTSTKEHPYTAVAHLVDGELSYAPKSEVTLPTPH